MQSRLLANLQVTLAKVMGAFAKYLEKNAKPAVVVSDHNLKFCDIDPCSSDSDLSDVVDIAKA